MAKSEVVGDGNSKEGSGVGGVTVEACSSLAPWIARATAGASEQMPSHSDQPHAILSTKLILAIESVSFLCQPFIL